MDAEEVTFNDAYRELWETLPASQRREAVKRLSGRRKDPLPVEALGEANPEIEECLKRLSEAYGRKKTRCAASSARRRQAMKAAAAAAESVEPVAVEPESAVAEPAVVVAEVVAEPAEPAAVELEPEPEPIPASARLKRRESAATGTPKPRVPKPDPAPSQPVPVPQPQKRAPGGGLLRKRTPRQDGEAAPSQARAARRPLIARRLAT